jgi:hypothetical protein
MYVAAGFSNLLIVASHLVHSWMISCADIEQGAFRGWPIVIYISVNLQGHSFA